MLKASIAQKVEIATEFQRGKHLRLKPSTRTAGGDGLFAKAKLRKGAVITKYRGFIVDNKNIENYSKNEYRLALSESKTMVGDPSGPFDACKSAQYVNDYSAVGVTDAEMETPLLNLNERLEDYIHSMKHCNCFLVRDQSSAFPYLMMHRTTKASEEIFLHYGLNYWIPRWLSNLEDAGQHPPYILTEVQRAYRAHASHEVQSFINLMRSLGYSAFRP